MCLPLFLFTVFVVDIAVIAIGVVIGAFAVTVMAVFAFDYVVLVAISDIVAVVAVFITVVIVVVVTAVVRCCYHCHYHRRRSQHLFFFFVVVVVAAAVDVLVVVNIAEVDL